MRDQIMSQYLKTLGSAASPGGGAVAALHVAQAAALLGEEALSMHALRLAEKEAHAHRSLGAAVPEDVIEAAAAVLTVAEARGRDLDPTTLAAAVESARAAACTARVSLEASGSSAPTAAEVCARADRLTSSVPAR